MSDAAVAVARPAGRARNRVAVALLLLGLLVAFVPGVVAGYRFLPVGKWVRLDLLQPPALVVPASATPNPQQWRWFRVSSPPGTKGQFFRLARNRSGQFVWPACPPWTSAPDLVAHEPGWAAAALALAITPLLFAWWRKSGASFGRVVGITCCLAAGAAVGALAYDARRDCSEADGGVWWTVPLGAALMAAAFVVAPAPRPHGDE